MSPPFVSYLVCLFVFCLCVCLFGGCLATGRVTVDFSRILLHVVFAGIVSLSIFVPQTSEQYFIFKILQMNNRTSKTRKLTT
jgi:hypothetical protein